MQKTTPPLQRLYGLFITALRTLWAVFSSLVVIVGFCVIMYFTGAKDFALWVYSHTWQETQCEIRLASYDRRESSKSGSSSTNITFKIVTSYTYRDDYGSYRGDRYHFEPWRTSYQSVKQDFSHLKSNTYLPCFYSARFPELSVIDRSFQSSFLWMLIPLLSIGPFAYLALRYLLQLTLGRWVPALQPKPRRRLP
jgi:hypothetical protein